MNQSTIQEKALAVWTEIWELAGEQWPPTSIPVAWRVYECLKEALVGAGVSEAQAIAFADDFFYGQEAWGDLRLTSNHKRAVDALIVALLDSELVELGTE
ncbi:MAG: hypothetical protein SWK90_00660 [Chloroflexota bacterium]|nr:hypothetical protein [Chloroflexota bacterium]